LVREQPTARRQSVLPLSMLLHSQGPPTPPHGRVAPIITIDPIDAREGSIPLWFRYSSPAQQDETARAFRRSSSTRPWAFAACWAGFGLVFHGPQNAARQRFIRIPRCASDKAISGLQSVCAGQTNQFRSPVSCFFPTKKLRADEIVCIYRNTHL